MITPYVNDQLVENQIHLANSTHRPLYLVLIATKPCYIKLASLVLSLHAQSIPFLAIDAGQHFDKELINAQHELQYGHLIPIFLNIRGTLLERTGDLSGKISWLAGFLQNKGLRERAIPVVSGDTSTAGIFPILWYLKTSVRSIHVEAGLRSLSPFTGLQDIPDYREAIAMQRGGREWQEVRDEPFPEGIDTRLATVCSQLLFAPVSINRQILLKEGQSSKDIHIVGSLSADAVDLICRQPADSSVFNIYPFLKEGSWIRIDLHRRENMMATTIRNILEAVQKLARRGFRIIIIMTNALNRAIQVHDLKNEVAELLKYENVKITPIWQEYYHVIEFIRSGHCLGLYTDSGGLQEETQILNVPCITCRYSTDRPETVILVKNNLLVPPFSATFISQSLEYIFTNKPDLFTNHDRLLYSTDVGKKIADILKDHSPVPSPVLHDVFDSAVINQ